MPHDNCNRRATDSLDINRMIAEENEPSRRALLVVLSSLATNVAANTKTTEAVSASLSAHLKTFDSHVSANAKLLHTWRGASKVLTWILGIFQLFVVGAISVVSTKFTDLETHIAKVDVIIAEHSTMLKDKGK